jgi:hypothetical protein
MEEILFGLIFPILGAISSVIAIGGIVMVYIKVKAKDETLFGDEAENRFLQIEAKMPKDSFFGPYEHKGGNIKTPKLEVRRVEYDPQTMGTEWKGVKKTVRYFYEENGKKWIKGWRFK